MNLYSSYWGKSIYLPKMIAFLIFSQVAACQSAMDKVVYSAYEKVGIEKRDLLKRRVMATREDQKDVDDSLKDALQELKKIYKFDGGKTEKIYNSLNSSYESSKSKADEVKESIEKMERVAKDLFEEWAKENSEIGTQSLKTKSQQSLNITKRKFANLDEALRLSESRIQPVLRKFRDQVLFLKHNLNAQALITLRKESATIEIEIENLLQEMEKSIARSDQFIVDLEKPE